MDFSTTEFRFGRFDNIKEILEWKRHLENTKKYNDFIADLQRKGVVRMKPSLNPAVKRGVKTLLAAAVAGGVFGALNSLGVVLPSVLTDKEWLAVGTAVLMALEKYAENVFGKNL
jgi:hypothetical protein